MKNTKHIDAPFKYGATVIGGEVSINIQDYENYIPDANVEKDVRRLQATADLLAAAREMLGALEAIEQVLADPAMYSAINTASFDVKISRKLAKKISSAIQKAKGGAE